MPESKTTPEIITGLQIAGDRKTNLLTLEFPYGQGLAAEVVLTPDKAIRLAIGLVMSAVELQPTPEGEEALGKMKSIFAGMP